MSSSVTTAWVFTVVGLLFVGRGGVVVFAARRGMNRRECSKYHPKPYAVALLLMGLGFLMDGVPVLSGVSSWLRLVFSAVALVPLLAAVRLMLSARSSRKIA